jgi:hypothetical protein
VVRASVDRRAIALLTVLMWLGAAAGSVQAQPAPGVGMRDARPEEDIVVEGKPIPEPDVVKKQAETITRMDDFYTAPLAQFQERVCPGIIGLPVAMAEIMVDRMRYNAERIGLETARSGKCTPNIFVAFVINGQREVTALARSRPQIFANIELAELNEMLAETGPVHAWNSTQQMTRDGMPVGASQDLTGQPPVVQVPIADSRIMFATRLDIAQSVVLIDVAAIDGMAVVQLADYASMRAFARTLPVRGDTAASTILSLFDKGSAPPRELTPFDLGYLRSLYATQGNLPASAKIGAVPRQIKRVLADAQDRADAGDEAIEP